MPEYQSYMMLKAPTSTLITHGFRSAALTKTLKGIQLINILNRFTLTTPEWRVANIDKFSQKYIKCGTRTANHVINVPVTYR